MCHEVFELDASTNHATFSRVEKTRKSTPVKRFTRLEAENYPLTLEKRQIIEKAAGWPVMSVNRKSDLI